MLGMLLSLIVIVPAPASAQATCVDVAVCAGETTQSPCNGPSPKQDPWDGFTGAWGNVTATKNATGVGGFGNTSSLEWGAGGWSRCYDTEWAAGAFVNFDELTGKDNYLTVMVRIDVTQRNARDCYAGGGIYGGGTWRDLSRDYYYPCPESVKAEDLPPEAQDPGWGNVLP